MATNISIITVHAPIEKLWDTLKKPELVKLWQYGSDLITTWEPGTAIRFKTEWQGKILEQWGHVLEVRSPGFLLYSLFAPRPGIEDKPENYFTMRYTLTTENEQTKLEIVQEDNRAHAVQQEVQGEENPVLQLLKKVAEKA
jgi:uncharacterized protein YndB with AHSA1/START domain